MLLWLLEAADASSDCVKKTDAAVLTARAQGLREEIRVAGGTGVPREGVKTACVPGGGVCGGGEEEGRDGGELLLAGLHWRLARARLLLVHGQVREGCGLHLVYYTI